MNMKKPISDYNVLELKKYDDELRMKSREEINNHYIPLTERILIELEKIANPKDKIQYLKSKEVDYLIDVYMNPILFEASGTIIRDRPSKVGLDGWIELNIKKIEIELNKKETKKNIPLTYLWHSNPDTELPELYSLMINKYKLIAQETTYEQFKAVFKGHPIDEIEPIKWHQNNASELLYFNEAIKNKVNNVWHIYQRLAACFVKPDGKPFNAVWKSLKTNIEINLSPDKQKAIDELIRNF